MLLSCSDDEPLLIISADVRLVLKRIRAIVTHSLGLNAAQWSHFKCNNAGPQQRILFDWISPNPKTTNANTLSAIIFYVLPNAALQVSAFLPSKHRFNKATFLIKTRPEWKLSSANFTNTVIHGDIAANLVGFTSKAIRSIFAPLLCNQSMRWPTDTAADVNEHMQRVLCELQQAEDMSYDDMNGTQNLLTRRQRRFELSSATLSLVERLKTGYSGQIEDAKDFRRSLDQTVIGLCIDLERALKSSHFSNNSTSASDVPQFTDECIRWKMRWNYLLSINDQLRELDSPMICEMLEAQGSTAYLNSFEITLQMVHDETKKTIEVVAILEALANELRSIQNASLQEMLESVEPIVHCLTIGKLSAPHVDEVRLGCVVCGEFIAEIRRALSHGGGVTHQTNAEDVQRIRLAEMIIQTLQQSIKSKVLFKTVDMIHMTHFAQRLEQIRGILEAACDGRHLESIALVCGDTRMSSNLLLHLVDGHRQSLVQNRLNNATDLLVEQADFSDRTKIHLGHVGELNRTAIDVGFGLSLMNCGTREHCQHVRKFIDDLYCASLKTQFEAQLMDRVGRIYRIEIKCLDDAIRKLCRFDSQYRIDARLGYPTLANLLLSVQELRQRFDSWQKLCNDWVIDGRAHVERQLKRLAEYETDTVEQFLVVYQHYEKAARKEDILLNVLILKRLGVSHFRKDNNMLTFLHDSLRIKFENSTHQVKYT